MHAAHLETIAAGYLRWIVLFPLLGFVFHVAAGRRAGRGLVGAVACASVAAAFAVAVGALLALSAAGEGAALRDAMFTWIHAGPLAADAAFVFDRLSAVMCLVVTGVGLLIHVYSTGYMAHDPDYARYFAYLNLFTASMLVLVLADNLVLLFVGWEGVGLCSYLLIGFWYADAEKASAGKKAFIVNRIGDAGFLLGTFVLFWGLADVGAASLRFADITAHAADLAPGVAALAALLLFAGATGKSAQIPLFVWLPDAMAGPTPVSALIHAATMVTAGVYMVARLAGLYEAAPLALDTVAIIGAATAFLAATVGLAQNDIKKVLAYSTVSQLGYMFLALGAGAFAAALFHVVTHAFFKALLFLGAGSVIHALDEEQDIRRMGGLRARLPITYWTFVVATLAIAGVPGFSGFFSKDAILASTFAARGPGLWLVGVAGAAFTALYMGRLLALTFHGRFRGDRDKWEHAHESPPSMAAPLVILAVLAAAGGYLGVPHVLGGSDAFGEYLAPAVGRHAVHLSPGLELGLMATSTTVAVAALLAGLKLYAGGPAPDEAFATRAGALRALLADAYGVDRFYTRTLAGGVVACARALWKGIDVAVIDGLANGVAALFWTLADSWRRWATGNVQSYAFTLLIGSVALVGFAVAAVLARG